MSADPATESTRRANEEFRAKALAGARAELVARLATRLQAVERQPTEPNEEALAAALRWVAEQMEAMREGRTFADRVCDLFMHSIATDRYVQYVDYALKAVERGRAAVELAGRHARVEGARYLDVGSGWGGCLIAFAQAGAREAVGFEIDERLVEISRVGLAEHAVCGAVAHADVMEGEAIAGHGAFDVITCTDVIEHVADPRRLIVHLARLCAPGGVVIVTAPNRHAWANVLADPHHRLFGSILLDREDSQRRFQERFPPGSPYTLGEIWDLPAYLAAFEQCGLKPALETEPARSLRSRRGGSRDPGPDGIGTQGRHREVVAELEAACADLARQHSELEADATLRSSGATSVRSTSPQISEATRAALARALDAYLGRLREDLGRLGSAPRDAALTERLAARYCIVTYTIVAKA